MLTESRDQLLTVIGAVIASALAFGVRRAARYVLSSD
jgi:hypothetical protein